jgi:hypothetical protein
LGVLLGRHLKGAIKRDNKGNIVRTSPSPLTAQGRRSGKLCLQT